MPLDPDELLIFQVRRKSNKEPEQPKPAPEKQEPAQPETAKPTPEPKPQPTPSPSIAQAQPEPAKQVQQPTPPAAPPPQPQPKQPEPEVQLPKMEPKAPQILLQMNFPQEKQQKPKQQQPQTAQTPQDKKKQPQPKPTATTKPQVAVPKYMPTVIAPGTYEQVDQAIRAATGGVDRTTEDKKTESRTGAQNREAAGGLTCVQHPWRSAYAVCGYCHRPFCFEDTTNLNGNYYCFDDLDKVASKPIEAMINQYNKLSLVSALLFIVPFFIFLYYTNVTGVFAQMSTYLTSNAVVNATKIALVSGFNAKYEAPLEGILLTFLGMVCGFLIMLKSRASFLLSLGIGLLMIAFFGYSYLAAPAAYYFGVLLVITLLAIILLALSRNYIGGQEDVHMPEHVADQMAFNNTGRF